jgi:hypothetical protein
VSAPRSGMGALCHSPPSAAIAPVRRYRAEPRHSRAAAANTGFGARAAFKSRSRHKAAPIASQVLLTLQQKERRHG